MEEQVVGWAIVGILGVVGVSTLYQTQKKIDEFEEKAHNNFVNKDVCKVVHENIDRRLEVIQKDLRDLLNISGNKRNNK